MGRFETLDKQAGAAWIADAFARAIECARAFEGATAPNPPVGCVLLDDEGRQLAAAAHQKAGGPHAEALAIEACRANGTTPQVHTAVVTLEPCNHHGRTPPCSEALLATPVRVVWIACRDPNTQVAGGGAERLAAAGLAVHFLDELDDPRASSLKRAADRLIAPFAHRMHTGLPFVTVKQAVTGEGSMIPPAGSKTFTSSSSLRLAHVLRRRADAILTGSGTILADEPLLTVRHVADHPGKHRMLAILDRRGRVPPAYLEAAQARGFVPIIARDPAEALAALGDAGALEVLVEAGPRVTEAMLSRGLWDEHVLIESLPAAEGGDRISVRRRDAAGDISEGGVDVLGYY
ncbi:bifunctional diaminohydroxyphosphoribosylaminopyrimidine deaminase/5-amino-6-(5-phosphoribosylamino)uracil reductase [Altererythrobacter sp. B11]|uniref:bifunctional diaminohydroxyphosphoribosylaminopyrimidine deaminase/5-amino-6-(5-phosphoribosylamino)uracil reductase RibD n=1 Tax=Altererythrobacter sp. B11 TaxID=2060312 RepID=UPI000DC73B72|nr:bifunctional diaminohydroxyphosphoribosylaminopyrimidine deaminase/5-amino-6-(5-phosphoribosylamino)uracil reductase RibD [Altererythrobacter sp. B11]BBC71974.1 bifunctional diaminohydroxyphosphoribosylaminopyrimidine deaminase/5-amino-6-(5-phosphoribosylamino)uracil reductase [Altererythrobacter sp. B11]